MFDELDNGARTGVWVALGIVAFVIFGLLGGLVIRQMGIKAPAAAVAASASQTGVAIDLEEFLDVPLAGNITGTLFFDTGSSALHADAPEALEAIRAAAEAAPARRLVISGFHDASGGAVLNHDLAKQRAVVVRDALVAQGVDRARLSLRKPESTLGGGYDDPQGRRVEVHLVD